MNLRSLAIVGAVATILLSACGWTQQDFDGGHSRANELETALTAANVGSLERHTVTVPNAKIVEAFTLANWLVLATTVGTVAYDRHTCPPS